MGLGEATAPIYENGVVIGYLMIGQILCKEDLPQAAKKIEMAAKTANIDQEPFLALLKQMPCHDKSYINACVRVMSMCATYLYCNRIIKNKKKSFVSPAR